MTPISPTETLRAVAAQFDLAGDFMSASPYGSGHINDTYAITCNQAGIGVRYILQRINHNGFKNPVAVMQNIERVTAHLQRKLADAGGTDISRRVLTLRPAREGRSFYADAEGNRWRCYLFIEGAKTYDQIESAAQATAAARAFGEFQKLLADLPAPRLHDTIPGFHHTRQRFETLRQASERDAVNRAAGVQREIEFVLAREQLVDVLLNAQAGGELPERVTHNDTKLNNVMLDDRTDNHTREGVTKALREGPYGRCVYACDNDVVDNQVVLLDFTDGATASFTMTAFTPTLHCQTRLFGTRGCIETDSVKINVFDFITEKETVVDTSVAEGSTTAATGYGGGDYGLMKAFVAAVAANDPAKVWSRPDESLASHRIVFAAERARREKRVVTLGELEAASVSMS